MNEEKAKELYEASTQDMPIYPQPWELLPDEVKELWIAKVEEE